MKKDQLIKLLIVLAIFFSFSFLRFYNLEKRFTFGWDQEQFSYQIKNIVKDHKFTLLGPRVNNDLGFFLAPYFTYLLIPFYLITNLHPNALIIFIIFFNLIFFLISYLVLQKIFDFKKAIIFLSFWSTNYLLADYDTVPWWPVTIPLGVIIIWYLLHQIYHQKKNIINWFFLGIFLGFFTNMHFQFVFIVLFSLIFLFLIESKNKKIRTKKWLLFAFAFLLMFLPLLIFDLRHNFLNLKLFVNFFFSKRALINKKDVNIWWSVFGNALNPILNYENIFKNQLPIKIFYFLIIGGIIYLIKFGKNYQKLFYQATFFLWLIFPLAFIFYGQRPSEYYFVFLYPFIYISLIDLFITTKKQFVLILIMIFLLFLTKEKIKKNFNNNYFGLYYKNLAVKKLKKLTIKKKFNISYDTELGRNYGFNYLLDYYQIKQSGNFKDPLIEIRIPPKENDIKINQMIGLKIPKELKD